MYLSGWKYEGRKIADKLHEQMLQIIEILNDPNRVAGRNWPALQKYISVELGIATGQVRTIKRMMEEFGIVKKGVLNASSVPKAEEIYTKQGNTLVELLETEKLMRENPSADNFELIKEIKSIYQLYYQKVLTSYCYNDDGDLLHPLRATLKALRKYGHLNYWEWYLLNTVIRNDDDANKEAEFDRFITEYRTGKLHFKDTDIIENQLSHSYVLGNFEYAGLVCVEGSKFSLKITPNEEFKDVIDEIIS
mgnify:CR=1 FL=1